MSKLVFRKSKTSDKCQRLFGSPLDTPRPPLPRSVIVERPKHFLKLICHVNRNVFMPVVAKNNYYDCARASRSRADGQPAAPPVAPAARFKVLSAANAVY